MYFMIAYVMARRYGQSTTTLTSFRSIAPVEGKLNHYTFSLSLKTGGIHRSICEPVTLKLMFDPRQLTFNVLYVLSRMLVSLAHRDNHPSAYSHQNIAFPENVCTHCVYGFAINPSISGSSPTMHSGLAPTPTLPKSQMPSTLPPGSKHPTGEFLSASSVGQRLTSFSGRP